MSVKLNEVRAFVAVAITGSVQTAATQLHMTQSAVSRLVQRLECDLGATLFDRQAKPLALTSDGEIALAHGLHLLQAAEALSDALAPGSIRGMLRIGSAHALAGLVAGHPLDQLRAAFPDVTPQVTVGWAKPLISQVAAGQIDAAIITLLNEDQPTHDLPARRLGREAVHVAGASCHDARAFRSILAMNAVGWVIQPEGCGYRTALTRALERIGAGPPRILVEAFGLDLQLAVVARGTAFALLPERQIKLLPPRKKIRSFAVGDFKATISTWIVRRPQLGRLTQPLDVVESALETAIA